MTESSDKLVKYQIYLSKEDHDRLDRLGRTAGLSFSQYVRWILKDHLSKAEK